MPIYIIRAGDTDKVKIGWAIDVPRRFQTLQSGNCATLRLLRLIDRPQSTERWLHQHFANLRQRGEWFLFSPEMLTIEPPLPAHRTAIEDDLLQSIEEYLSAAQLSATLFGRLSVNDPSLVFELRRGRECRRSIRSRIMTFMASAQAQAA